ncbi:MAG: alpha-L-rhamnosidase N-terminal domain-containing protein [Acidobacteriota bacterium]|nr:alpha-L-rhamnosidase N-terminal domain-containing protein [Acidobacteriota bacterium]
MKRREFIKSSALAGGSLLSPPGLTAHASESASGLQAPIPSMPLTKTVALNLRPAHWIWYPSERTLQNTVVLFRRQLDLPEKPLRAKGWVVADGRYKLEVNGQRVQWGPAPCDPRWLEVDPMDLTEFLHAGANTLGAQVLFFGQGDGTWPIGKCGFIFWLEIETAHGEKQTIVSDGAWQAYLARSWKPGHYKRWYLRALQEEFDARLFPYGWTSPGFAPNQDWLPAMPLECPADKPAICSTYPEYMLNFRGDPGTSQLRARSIPLMRETPVPAARLAESCWIEWDRSPEEYFEFMPPNSFRPDRKPAATEGAAGSWDVELDGRRGAALTFEFAEQMVGWPYFTIEAPAGTTIELMVQEAHQVGGPALLNTHFHSWTRFICREGINHFETFDFECCRWVQLHIHGASGKVTISNVGMRRRVFPWPHSPAMRVSEPPLQRLIDATINTLNNCAQETMMDGGGRERQQYSGDGAHQLHPLHLNFGETRLPARFLATFSQGLTEEGFFLDAWPAYDRLARLIERQLHLTQWGPLLDHGVGFNFDCFYHYLYSGDLDDLREPYPRLLRFAQYLESIMGSDGLLPVENLGIPAVWMDHIAYQRQRHKQCAFNLYAAAMLQNALPRLCEAFGDPARAQAARDFGRHLQEAAVRRFWSPEKKLFLNNLPWLSEEGSPRLCDRSLATAILFDQCPKGQTDAVLRVLADCPPEMGFSYPDNACWRLWALGKGGRADIIVRDFRERWANMESVLLNNTLQEDWHAKPDSGSEWSHTPVIPLYVTTMSLAGIKPLVPGFKRCEIRPQMADLDLLELTVHSVQGPIEFSGRGKIGSRELTIRMPSGCVGELVVDQREVLALRPIAGSSTSNGLARYHLAAGQSTSVHLKFT